MSGQRGLVPSNFVEKVADESEMSMMMNGTGEGIGKIMVHFHTPSRSPWHSIGNFKRQGGGGGGSKAKVFEGKCGAKLELQDG